MRIATGCIGHETNTFSPVPTTYESFRNGSYHADEEVIHSFQQTRTITGGVIRAAEEYDLELVPLLWTFATPSGTVSQDAYETLKADFLIRLENASPVDGVLLDLHGAMVTELNEDAEGDLIQSVRENIGSVPIVTTLDLHANITSAMAQWSDVIIGFDTYPHVDSYERGIEAAKVMADIVRGSLKPTMAYRQLPLLTSPPAQCTMKPLMEGVLERLHALESGDPGNYKLDAGNRIKRTKMAYLSQE